MADTIKEQKIVSKKTRKRDYTYAVGRQKEAVARVRLYPHLKENSKWGENPLKKGQIIVNEKLIEYYFPGPLAKAQYTKPLIITDTFEKYAITVKVEGGGRKGQLNAMVKGISKGLASIDPKKFRQKLKSIGLLTRDARVRQRRNVGTGGKARRKKQSPKR